MSWVAWHGDILPGNDRLLMKVPVATDSGKSITGRIRTEHILEQDGVTSVSLGNGPYTGNSHDGYEAVSTDPGTATLTMREYQWHERVPGHSDSWTFGHCPDYDPGKPVEPVLRICACPKVSGAASSTSSSYEAKNPRVMAVGLASTRDALSFFRFAGEASGIAKPLFEDGRPSSSASS